MLLFGTKPSPLLVVLSLVLLAQGHASLITMRDTSRDVGIKRLSTLGLLWRDVELTNFVLHVTPWIG
jgi:hypothetical protein